MRSRLRLIGGPNGSGKTTLTNSLRAKLGDKFSIYLNADEMEQSLRTHQSLDFTEYNDTATQSEFALFYEAHALHAKALVEWAIIDNLFVLRKPLARDTYFPTLFADFVRELLLQNGISFAFETVMSDAGKIDLLKRAQGKGYRTYLYFVCIEDPFVNVSRVARRVENKGHSVPTDRILDRYARSLNHLRPAIANTNRAFLWDNSGTEHKLVATITDGKKVEFDIGFVPRWFEDNLLKK